MKLPFTRLLLLWFCILLCTPVLAQSSISERLDKLRGLATSSTEQEFLHPDQAFIMSASVEGPNLITAQFQIASGYYLYHDQFKFEVISGDATVDNARVVIPPGKIKEDPSFGKVEINTGDVSIAIPLIRKGQGETGISLQIAYQGCKDESLCYPPIKKTVPLILAAVTNVTATDSTSAAPVAAQTRSTRNEAAVQPLISEQDAFTKKLREGSMLVNILLFFGAGLLLAVTPCVFPMIPILSGIIVGQEKTVTPTRGFLLSLVYVIAMALTYAIVGVIAAMADMNIQAAAQNVWVISVFCLVFVALALSMFGFYEIQMPAFIQDRLVKVSNSQQGGTLSGVAIMGSVSAIIVGPCVAPPLIGALAYISQTGNELLGGLALFAMGLGMGAPLLIIGASAGSLLPKAGSWMDTVKQVFGVGLLALAIWFIARVVSITTVFYLCSVLLIVSAIYMGALEPVGKHSGWTKLWKGIGLILLSYGILLLIGAASGAGNFFKPLENITRASGNSQNATESHLVFKRIKSVADLDATLQQSGKAGKITMLDFYADWCIECIRMGSSTFTMPEVKIALQDVTLLQADVTANDAEDKALLTRFGIYGPPAILFFDQDGKEKTAYRLFGYSDTDKFTRHVNRATGKQ